MLKLHYLPPALPDEHFASFLARAAERDGLVSAYDFQTIGIRSARFVTSVKRLIPCLPASNITLRSLIQEKCIFPFYAPFISSSIRLRHLRWAFEGGRTGDIPTPAAHRPLRPRTYRLCPKCVEEDKHRFGEPYFHRRHQLEGIDVCLKHQLILQDTNCMIDRPRLAFR